MAISQFDYHIEKKTVTTQIVISLCVIPRLHKEGYFVGIVPQFLFIGEAISKKDSDRLFKEWNKHMDKEIAKMFDDP